MRFSQQAQYAICGMFDLAYNGESVPVQVRVIGERQRIPARYLEQIFQRLRRAELVRGKRGPGGGYVLTRPPAEITLRQIIEAVEGPLADGLAGGPPPRDRRPAHRPNFLWTELCERIEAALGEISLEQVCHRAAGAAVRRADADTRVYHI
jgi:Rrf2 family transcriptional regulator, iron-sulfur cluster assembly transcription factor